MTPAPALVLRPAGDAAALEPCRTQSITRLDLLALETGHVGLHEVADARLYVGQMAIAELEAFEHRRIKRDAGRGIDGGDAVFFVDRLAQHDPPPSLALFQEIIEAAGANDVGQLALDLAALRNRHLGLRDRPRTDKVEGEASEEVQNAHPLVPTVLRHSDELL